ncbi:unnamed protein product [Prunus armeniaca]
MVVFVLETCFSATLLTGLLTVLWWKLRGLKDRRFSSRERRDSTRHKCSNSEPKSIPSLRGYRLVSLTLIAGHLL